MSPNWVRVTSNLALLIPVYQCKCNVKKGKGNFVNVEDDISGGPMGVVVAASRKSRWVELTCKAISSGETAPRSQKGQREAFLKVDIIN